MSCSRCSASLRPDARFRSSCGLDLPGVRREELERARRLSRMRARSARRVTAGIAIAFGATLGALLLGDYLAERWGLEVDLGFVALHAGLMLAAGVLSAAVLGGGAWREALFHWPERRWFLMAPLVGALTFAGAAGYWALVQ